MRKERARSVKAAIADGETLTRTTCFLSEAQDYNLDVLALHSGKSKGNLIREGIVMVLKQYGFPEHDRVIIQLGLQPANGHQHTSVSGQPQVGDNDEN